MSAIDCGNFEYFPQTLSIKLLDSDGDLAGATIQSCQQIAAAEYDTMLGNDASYACRGPDVSLLYCIAIATTLFFEDALVAWGDQYDEMTATEDNFGGTWAGQITQVFA